MLAIILAATAANVIGFIAVVLRGIFQLGNL
jgi:hypothetical protein